MNEQDDIDTDSYTGKGSKRTLVFLMLLSALVMFFVGYKVFAANAAPTISGTPATSVEAGKAYSFFPTAKDPEGKSLSFTISNRPTWASFAYSTGSLKGTPKSTGKYCNIKIYVSDGVTKVGTASWCITVTAATTTATGSATLTWTAPTKNTDESALTDLKSYKIYYGTSSSDLSKTIDAGNVTTYKVDSLAAGTWYFAVAAVNTSGAESAKSSVASKKIG